MDRQKASANKAGGVCARLLDNDFCSRTASPHLDASLRLATQENHEIRAVPSFRAQGLVRDDQGRSRRGHPGETIQCVLRNANPIERAPRAARIRRHWLDSAAPAPPRLTLGLDYAAVRMSALLRLLRGGVGARVWPFTVCVGLYKANAQENHQLGLVSWTLWCCWSEPWRLA